MQAHPRYRELVEQGFAAASFVGDLGIRPLDCGPGWVEAGLDILPRHAQQNGFIHAGVQATLADHAAGAAAATLVEEGQTVLTLSSSSTCCARRFASACCVAPRCSRPGAR